MYTVPVNHELMENNPYPDPSFPLLFFCDDYGALVDHTLNCHWHPDMELGLLLQGKVDFYLNGQLLPLEAGQVVVVNSGTLHTAHQRPEGGRAFIFGFTFRSELFSKEYPHSAFHRYFDSSCPGFRWDSSTEEGRQVIQGMEALRKLDQESFGFPLQCMSLLCQIWLPTAARMHEARREFPPAPGGYGGEVKRLLSYLHQHCGEKITLETLEGLTNLSRSQCFRRFRQYTGTTPMAYLNDYRLSKAAALLRTTDQTVTEICYTCGFSDASYFIHCFREKFGISPRRYRTGWRNTGSNEKEGSS